MDIKCTRCNTINPNQKYCDNCGEKIGRSIEELEEKKKRGKESSTTIICMTLIVGGIILSGMAGSIWFALIGIGLSIYLWNQHN